MTLRTSRNRSCKVLLVDDSDQIAQLISTFLLGTGVELTICPTARQGVEAFQKSPFDLVFMDLNMPEVDGFSATRSMRFWEASNGISPTPIAALTASTSKSDISKAFGAGCTHYLPKPIDRLVLFQTIRQYFLASRAPTVPEPAVH